MNRSAAFPARAAQRLAADPSLSAFVSANAGSGKTTVLVDRVLRLMLDGASPARILCLTYTKAAAANMALKVFERLAAWVTLSDAELSETLAELEGDEPGPRRLIGARRLFARAVETPGGLKIETIHAFCERILHLFPFEANVPARFEVLDEASAAALIAEATAAVLTAAAQGDRPDLLAAVEAVSLEASGDAFAAVIGAAVREKAFLRTATQPRIGLSAVMAGLAGVFGLSPGDSVAAIERAMLEDGVAPAQWEAIAAALAAGKKTDRERGTALTAAARQREPAARLRAYRCVFFTDEGTARADNRFVTQSIDPDLVARLRAERDRLVALDGRRKAAACLARTSALLTLAAAILARVEAEKSRRGALDFDDLIGRTRQLLARSDASWVLYKLDAGIDHVLVDEAQDTNPAQWEILRSLTADFTAGAGARGATRRTVFAVGDPKQSIYGFQGAEPRQFEASGRHFRRHIEAASQAFKEVPLQVSFRSAPAILAAVDAVFAIPEHFSGLSFDLGDGPGIGTVHESHRRAAHGRIDIWPLVRPPPTAEPEAWLLPVDEPELGAPPVVLARRIARVIRRWTTVGDAAGRLVPAGDILILVRKRGALFEAIIRQLKSAGVAVAGADRLKLGEHIGVMDLVAAGRAALLPEDDLTLATLLKSPLVGLDDEDLIRIGARRGDAVSFAAALGQAADAGCERAALARNRLGRWRALARSHGPFGFYATLAGPLGGREALVARLGPEAGDAIDEFLALAFAHERRETPSLAAFLAGFGDAAHEVKRDMDAARDEVRVMTVHGAKGLEAGHVILADGCRVDERGPPLVPVALPAGDDELSGLTIPAWSPRKGDDPAAVGAAREALRGRAMEEHNRLLYVAMTRARDHLVIATHVGKYRAGQAPPEPHPRSWLAMIRAGLEAGQSGMPGAGAAAADAPCRLDRQPWEETDEPMLVWQSGTPAADGKAARQRDETCAEVLPDWVTRPLPAEPEAAPPLRPSDALSAADGRPRAGDGPFAADARLIGTLVHALIEHLPQVPAEARPGAAERFVAARAGNLDAAQRMRIVADALGVLDDARLAPLFGPRSRAEAPLAGYIDPGGGRPPIPVSGEIDRLAVTDEAIIIADFKTTARPPADPAAAPQPHVAQLALYRELLTPLFPGRNVRAFLVWTTGPLVLELPPERLDAALVALVARASGVREQGVTPP